MDKRNYTPAYKVEIARTLRQQQTESEALLWKCLRNRQLDGVKFRRQRPIERYVADFCCDPARLVVEIDGGIHNQLDRQEYDQYRERLLTAYGYTLLRFSCEEVLASTDTVLATIRLTLHQLQSLSPARGVMKQSHLQTQQPSPQAKEETSELDTPPLPSEERASAGEGVGG